MAAIVRLSAVGVVICAVAFAGLVLQASIFGYTEPVVDPLTRIYSGTHGRILLGATLTALCLLFGLALYLASKLSSPAARGIALGLSLAITFVFALVYSSGAQDVYHNILDFRTLWVYGDNPMLTPPLVHADDPLFPYVLAWEGTVSAYGPFFYLFGVPFSVAAGEDLLANLIAVKAMQAIALLLLAGITGYVAERLSPGRGVVAVVAIGWNPFIQWETMANAHNDAFMMVFAIAALGLATRMVFSQSLVALGLAAMMKYSALIIGPLIFLWSWTRSSDQQRRAVASLIFAGTMGAIVFYLVLPETVREIKELLTTDRLWKSPIAVLTHQLTPSLGAGRANDAARLISWSGVLLAYVVAARRLNATPRSLYQASFLVLMALACLSRPEFFSWYFIWFIPIGAVLAGGWEWRLSYLASAAGLLTYAVFPWSPNTPATNLLYVMFTFGAPLLLLFVWQLAGRIISRRSALASLATTALQHEIAQDRPA